MSKKIRAMPPPRPQAPPKVSVGGGAMSFSFKALEEEEEDELTSVTGKFDQKVHDEKEKNARAHDKERSLSKSPEIKSTLDTHMERSPSMKSQNSFDKLLDFKEKIQSELQKKKDEIFSDFREGRDKDRKETKDKKEIKDKNDAKEKTEINDKEKANKENKEKEPLTISAEKTVPLKSTVLSGLTEKVFVTKESLEDSGEFGISNDEGTDVDNKFFESKSVDSVEEEWGPRNGEELEIEDEYFNPSGEDFSSNAGAVPLIRQRKTLQTLRKIRPPPPGSMSKISKSLPEFKNSEETIGTLFKGIDKENVDKSKERKSVLNGIPVKKIVGGVILVLLYLIIPLPSYISGVILGVISSSLGWRLYIWVTEPAKPREPIPVDPPLEELPPLPVPEIKEAKGEDGCYKGWMNELQDYKPEKYSINQTHSVYVHLEGTMLRLRRPKTSIPKRAMWDEPVHNAQFIHQRHFDIEGSKVLLLPSGLVKKRLWSKKYPICIALAQVGKKQVKPGAGLQSGKDDDELVGKMSTSSSTDSDQGFELVSEQNCDSSILYLFARTCHEKEQWYRRFLAATAGTPLKNHIREVKRILESSATSYKRSASTDSLRHKRQSSSDSLSSVSTNLSTADESCENDLKNFVSYMSRLIPRDKDSLPSSPVHVATSTKEKDSKTSESKLPSVPTGPKGITCEPALLPLNALLGRLFFDFLGDQYWADKVKQKLQNKLSKIHIPYFIEELKISEISLGSEVPVIRRANRPYMDENGFWIDVDVTYSGKFKMTIETKVNLMKLKVKSEKKEVKKSAVTDEEEEDSAESSTDEEEEISKEGEDGSAQSGSTGKKLMKIIDKITASRYFQSATELKYVKKAMTEVSNTRLILTVEMQKLTGVLAINIPPPPTDRLWYGFRGNPQLWLVAKPKVGEREVTMNYITEWIEKKLALEFQHVLVMPNMDDLVIPILMAGPDVDAATHDEPHSRSGSTGSA